MKWLATALLLVQMAACGGPQATPPGQPLSLVTAPTGGNCASAGLLPVRVGRTGDEMTFVSVGTGAQVSIVWPVGFSARDVDHVAKLFSSKGQLIAGEGDILDNLGGSFDEAGTTFMVCSIGATTY